jgi:predicted acylesterase/phospholipase RssA
MRIIILALALVTCINAKNDPSKCYALALSGGANNGAWEAGVMWGFTHYDDPSNYYWKVLTGVSAGAINSMYISAWAPEDALAMAEATTGLWANLKSSDIYVEWPEGIKGAVRNEASLFNDAPALEFFHETMLPFDDFKKAVTIGSVNIATGEYWTFNQTNTNFT